MAGSVGKASRSSLLALVLQCQSYQGRGTRWWEKLQLELSLCSSLDPLKYLEKRQLSHETTTITNDFNRQKCLMHFAVKKYFFGSLKLLNFYWLKKFKLILYFLKISFVFTMIHNYLSFLLLLLLSSYLRVYWSFKGQRYICIRSLEMFLCNLQYSVIEKVGTRSWTG